VLAVFDNLLMKIVTFAKFGTRKSEVLNSLIMKITANENDTNDILQTLRELLLSSSVCCKLNCSDLPASSYGHSGEKRCEKWKTRSDVSVAT